MHFFPSLLFTSVVAAHSLGHGGHARLHQHHQRQTASQVLTTGGNGDGQVHSRLEISDLAANRPDQFSLLIQAMTQWEAQPPANQTSYYQIAGIHGVPRATWDGVSPCENCSNADGYATHDSVLFPTWHRAYLALYEQQLLDVAYQVAAAYPAGARRDAMLTAQKSLRLPYWDWAAKTAGSADVLPAVLASPQVTIDGPNGQETIANPLYAFKIPVDSAMVYSPFTNWQSTLRYPSSNDANAASADQSAVNAFNNIQGSMQESVYQLLTTCKDYAHFSNDHADSSATACTTNLEAIHNTIHTTAGGPGGNNLSGGHMTYLSLAALDPMFFIHHANVDRIFALWQTLNPSSYGGSQVAPHTTWTIEAGSTQNADSPLEPFRRDATTFWTTNTVSDWAATFKYTYPEYAAGDGSKASIINYINELYGQNPTLTASSISKQVEKNSTDSDATASATAKKGLSPVSALYPTGASSIHWAANTTSTGRYPVGTGSSPSSGNGGQYEYNCNIHTPRYSLNDSYSIYVFDGQPSTDDSSKYLGDDNCVGTIGVLAGGSMAAEIIISGSVPLTRHLQGKVMGGQLASMGKSDVNAYLKQNLSWKIIRQGEEVHPDNVPGFKAAVYSAYSSPAGKGSLPQWSQQQPQIEGTQGKAGGINSQEEADKAWPQPPVSPSGSCPGPKPTSAPVYSPTATSAPAPPAYTPAPYPTNSAPVESSPTGGTAAPSGYGSMPSSSPITPYTGAGARLSGSSLAGPALCALAGMLLL